MTTNEQELIVTARVIARDILTSSDCTPSPSSAKQLAGMDVLDRERVKWFGGGAEWVLGEVRRGNVTGYVYRDPTETHPVMPPHNHRNARRDAFIEQGKIAATGIAIAFLIILAFLFVSVLQGAR